MIVVEINSVCHGSTGNIARLIVEYLNASCSHGILCVPRGRHNRTKKGENVFLFGSVLSEDIHILLSRITGIFGIFSIFATISVLRKIKQIKPDVIHLHNLHNSYINIPLLFGFIKKNNIPIVWTFHDCWPITGHCCHFEDEACEKWKTGCGHCIKKNMYPKSILDNSRLMYKLKKKWFMNVPNMTIVTPSQWLHDIVKESFFSGYSIRTINNGVNLDVFSRKHSNFKDEYGISKKKSCIRCRFRMVL